MYLLLIFVFCIRPIIRSIFLSVAFAALPNNSTIVVLFVSRSVNNMLFSRDERNQSISPSEKRNKQVLAGRIRNRKCIFYVRLIYDMVACRNVHSTYDEGNKFQLHVKSSLRGKNPCLWASSKRLRTSSTIHRAFSSRGCVCVF